MSLFSGTSKTQSTSKATPTNPTPVTEGIIDFTKLISSLGNQNPQQYVTGPSNLQNQAFGLGAGIAGRYGMGVPQGQPQTPYAMPGTVNTGGGQYRPGGSSQPVVQAGPSGGGLYQQAGVIPEKQYDYQGYVDSNPDIKAHYQSQIVTPKAQSQLLSTGADYDNNGQVSQEEFGRYHYDRHGQGEGRQLTQIGGQAPASMIEASQPSMGMQSAPLAQPGIGYTPAQMGQNPNDLYRDAAGMTRTAGNAGPSNYTASQVRGTEIDPVTKARARQGYQYSDPYENRYTDNVVDTTLANFDEYAGRQRAQEAAQAAGNNAFGGSRFGVQRAITEEQIARERASQEAGLRFGAQDRAFGLGMQDASQANQIAAQNAAAANQRAQAQAALEMQTQLANQGALNQAGQFNAGMEETALSRQLGAAGQLGNIAGAQAGNERADLQALATLGEQERGINQQSATADLELMRLMAQLYGTMPYHLFSGQTGTQSGTTTTNPGVLSVLGAGAMGLGSLGWNPLAKGP